MLELAHIRLRKELTYIYKHQHLSCHESVLYSVLTFLVKNP